MPFTLPILNFGHDPDEYDIIPDEWFCSIVMSLEKFPDLMAIKVFIFAIMKNKSLKEKEMLLPLSPHMEKQIKDSIKPKDYLSMLYHGYLDIPGFNSKQHVTMLQVLSSKKAKNLPVLDDFKITLKGENNDTYA